MFALSCLGGARRPKTLNIRPITASIGYHIICREKNIILYSKRCADKKNGVRKGESHEDVLGLDACLMQGVVANYANQIWSMYSNVGQVGHNMYVRHSNSICVGCFRLFLIHLCIVEVS